MDTYIIAQPLFLYDPEQLAELINVQREHVIG